MKLSKRQKEIVLKALEDVILPDVEWDNPFIYVNKRGLSISLTTHDDYFRTLTWKQWEDIIMNSGMDAYSEVERLERFTKRIRRALRREEKQNEHRN